MRLLRYADGDRALTVSLESDPAVMGHLGGAVGGADAERVHRQRLAGVADGDLFFTIVPDGRDDPVGIIAIWRTEWNSETVYELGAMLIPDFQARGIAVQAFDLILPYVLEKGITRLDSFPAVANRSSNAVLAKLGFTRQQECDLDYGGRPLRCVHWVRDLTGPAATAHRTGPRPAS
jgi:RimJ/RimL family protein N-acetyltransferase